MAMNSQISDKLATVTVTVTTIKKLVLICITKSIVSPKYHDTLAKNLTGEE